jgi:hypothetical protein
MMQVLNRLFKWNCFSAVGKIIIKNFIAHNGTQLYLVADFENKNLNYSQN